MPTLFLLLFLLTVVTLLLGLVKPTLVVRWGRRRTRGTSTLTYGVAAVFCFVMFVVTAPPSATTHPTPSGQTRSGGSSSNSGSRISSGSGSTSAAGASNSPASNSTGTVSSGSASTTTIAPVIGSTTSEAGTSTSGSTSSGSIGSQAPTRSSCRADWSAGVYHTYRFTLLSACRSASGVVESIRHESDHDYHLDLKLDSKYQGLLAPGNFKYQHGFLVVEIIPMDEPYIPVPSVGQRVTVTGAWVDDTDHGWNEIHPAWIVNGEGQLAFSKASAQASVITGICGNGDKDCPAAATTVTNPGGNSSTSSTSSASGLSVVTSTLDVTPGEYASVEVHTAPGSQGTITVEYLSGPSSSTSLYPKTADANGDLTWTWKVGTRTTPGNWPVTIAAGGQTLKLTLHVQ